MRGGGLHRGAGGLEGAPGELLALGVVVPHADEPAPVHDGLVGQVAQRAAGLQTLLAQDGALVVLRVEVRRDLPAMEEETVEIADEMHLLLGGHAGGGDRLDVFREGKSFVLEGHGLDGREGLLAGLHPESDQVANCVSFAGPVHRR